VAYHKVGVSLRSEVSEYISTSRISTKVLE